MCPSNLNLEYQTGPIPDPIIQRFIIFGEVISGYAYESLGFWMAIQVFVAERFVHLAHLDRILIFSSCIIDSYPESDWTFCFDTKIYTTQQDLC